MSDPRGIDVTLLGRTFRVACEEGEEKDLRAAVDYLDRKMTEIRDGGKVVGSERIAVMAALNIAHELLNAKTGKGFDMGSARRRIRAMEERLDRALVEQQERLF